MNQSSTSTPDHTVTILIVIVVLIVGLAFLGKEKLDNPLVTLSIFAIFAAAFFAFGRWAGAKTNMPGLVTFFGGSANAS